MTPVVFIPIKQNSSRFPGKNSLEFVNSRPLYLLTFDIASLLSCDVIVSSDDPHVLADADSYGFTIHKRSRSLSTADSPISALLSDVIKTFSIKTTIILLEVTSPLRSYSLIQQFIDISTNIPFDFAFTCEYSNKPPSKSFHFSKSRKLIANTVQSYSQNHMIDRSLHFNGLLYAYSSSLFPIMHTLNPISLLKDFNCLPLLTKRSVDIDYEDDFIEAQFLYKSGYSIDKFIFNF